MDKTTRARRRQAKAKPPSLLIKNEYLPAEILGHIAWSFTDVEILPPTKPTLLILTQVCRFWRNACMGNPHLWCSLSINLKRAYRLRFILQRLPDFWFSNAKDLPLAFTLNCPNPDYSVPDESGLLDPIVPYFHRLRVFRITANWITQLTTSSYPTDAFACLESAMLDIPKIVIWHGSQFAIPWSRLTQLEISQFQGANAFLSILHQCRSLKSGFFKLFNDAPGSIVALPTTMEYLAILTITYSQSRWDIGHLDTLHFPALRHLSVHSDYFSTPNNNFLRTFQGGTIRHLCLANIQVDSTLLVPFISACGALEELRVDLPEYGDGLFLDLQRGLEASKSGLRAPLALTSFVTCISASGYDVDDDWDGEPIPPQYISLSAFLIWWCDCLTASNHRRQAVVFVRGEVDEGSGGEDASYAQNEVDLMTSMLLGHIYNAETCPEGLHFQPKLCYPRYLVMRSPVVSSA